MRQRGGKSGTRLSQEVEAVIKDALTNFHDTEQKPSITQTVTEIRRLCSNAGSRLPAFNTVRNRLARTEGQERARMREGARQRMTNMNPSRRAIDVYSRVCVGMFLTLEAPSAMSAGMCVAHAILPKEAWLRKCGVTTQERPCWGVMAVLHMDNAHEFRGEMLKAACREYDIDIHFRREKIQGDAAAHEHCRCKQDADTGRRRELSPCCSFWSQPGLD